MAPASILQRHPNATIYLDQESAALLSQAAIETYRQLRWQLRSMCDEGAFSVCRR